MNNFLNSNLILFDMVVFTNIKKEDLNKLKGWKKESTKTIHEELRLTKQGVTLVLYASGKLLLQGKKDEVDAAAAELGKKNLGKKEAAPKFTREASWVIGSDEALKGDTFGGITVAAVKADDAMRKKLIELGVKDSKLLNDNEIVRMAEKIRMIAPCEVKSILPEEYNLHVRKITTWLNVMHEECASYLKPGVHIVDKYPGCSAGDMQEEKAESKYVEVAAASVLARDAALKQMSALSIMAGFRVPMGSTHVQLGLTELKHRGLDFSKFVKMDFGNVREFLK